MKLSPDYRLLTGMKEERSMSGSVAPGGRATLVVNEARLYHGFVVALEGGLQAQHIETVLVRYNQIQGYDADGPFFQARNIWNVGVDSDDTNYLYIDFKEHGLNGPGNDFRPSVNVLQRGPDGREVKEITLELKFTSDAPAGSGVRIMTEVGPAVPFDPTDGTTPAGPGVIKRIERVDETNLVAGWNTIDRLVPPESKITHTFIRRIWARINPAHIQRYEIRNGTQIESSVETAERIAKLSSPFIGRGLPADHFPLFDGLFREADKIDLTTFSKFELRLQMQDVGATPVPSRVTFFVEFEGAL